VSGPILLDVNVLVALFDAEHIHHEAAHQWFGDAGRGPWASCPLTENGLVRVISSAAYPGRRTTFADAVDRLRGFCESVEHVFWPDSISIRDGERFEPKSAQGHRQMTDIYLLALAVAHRGSLATFDRSIPRSAVRGASEKQLILLPA
jgi:uncharacterized protein